MKSDIFVEWLHHLDNWFRIMDQKILLLIDNAGSHFNPKTFDKDNSDLSEDEEEETVAESSHSAQNRTKSKKKATKSLILNLLRLNLFISLQIRPLTFSQWMLELFTVLNPNINRNFVSI
jgi:hypothetical protein